MGRHRRGTVFEREAHFERAGKRRGKGQQLARGSPALDDFERASVDDQDREGVRAEADGRPTEPLEEGLVLGRLAVERLLQL